MDLQRKAIQGLTIELDGKRDGLNLFYRQFGTKLFNDSADPLAVASPLSPARVDTWRNLMSTREADTQAILDIRAALSRQQEILRFRQELKGMVTSEKGKYRDQLDVLGRAFFDSYTGDGDRRWDDIRTKINLEKDALLRLEERHEKLKDDLESSGFFGKMISQFKMTGLSTKMRQAKERVAKLFADSAESLIDDGSLKDRVANGDFDSAFNALFDVANRSAEHLGELNERDGLLAAELGTIASTLDLLSAAESPTRRLNELQSKIRETDNRIDSLIIITAREYTDKFLDEDGMSTLGGSGDGNSFSDMGAYAFQLEEAAGLRAEIAKIRCRIEVLETAVRMDTLDKNIRTWNRSVTDYESKIRNYQELIVSLQNNVSDAEAERIHLAEHKADLEQKLL